MKLHFIAIPVLFTAALQHHCGVVHAQTAPASVAGTVTGFRVKTLEIGVQPDGGAAGYWKFGGATEVLRVPPGEHELSKATAARVTDISPGDRVLLSFVPGLRDARRIVVISAGEISQRNEAERLDWQKRGTFGIVSEKAAGEVTLETRTPQGVQHTTVTLGVKTKVRRYAPDSVKFAEAEPSGLAEIVAGDQLRVRGDRKPDGSIQAEDIVFGTFYTKVGTITAVHVEAGEIEIKELAGETPLTIRLSSDSQVKALPDMRAIFSGHGGTPPPAGPVSITKMLSELPVVSLDSLTVGGAVFVSSTRGSQPGRVTAILLLSNANALIEMAQKAKPGASAMDAISGLHGGMLSGPAGFTLPAILP